MTYFMHPYNFRAVLHFSNQEILIFIVNFSYLNGGDSKTIVLCIVAFYFYSGSRYVSGVKLFSQ